MKTRTPEQIAKATYGMNTCNQCGDYAVIWNEYRKTVISTRNANKQIAPTVRYCGQCHAHNEWQRQLAMAQSALRFWKDMDEDERARYTAKWGAPKFAGQPETEEEYAF